MADPIVGSSERDFGLLLRSMRPRLHGPVYLFATLPEGQELPEGVRPILRFHETEGVTVVVEHGAAVAAGLAGVFPCRMITLEVHSALDAVGFLAAVTACLAAEGIGVNPVAAFHHDHLFVPRDRAEAAMRALRDLAARHAQEATP
jgi:uncharacterized protein